MKSQFLRILSEKRMDKRFKKVRLIKHVISVFYLNSVTNEITALASLILIREDD